MMRKLFTGGMTSRTNHAGKTVFSAKQVSTTLLLLLLCMVMPSSMRGATTTIDFTYATVAAQEVQWNNPAESYINFLMSDQDYSNISGAKVGNAINFKYNGKYTRSVDISRLAFLYSSAGVPDTHNESLWGWYLYGERINNTWYRGLYTANQGVKLAIPNLGVGDKVTIQFYGSTHTESWGAGIYYECDGQYHGSNETVVNPVAGDMIISANKGTIINKITIETADVAQYSITSSNGTTTFTFTGDGVLEDNDFALPNLSASFGSINDYLVVSNYESHMIKSDGTETLETDGANNFQPSAGSFYAFKPTASGTISVDGTLLNTQGGTPVIHVFVYNPNLGYNNNWDECATGKYYRDTFYANDDISFTVEKGKTYYLCIDNGSGTGELGNVFHLHSFSFTTDFYVKDLGVVINNVDNQGDNIALTEVDPAGGYTLQVKRCSSNINPAMTAFIQNGWLYMSKPSFTEGTDHAGTVIWDLVSDGGSAAIVVTFPYSAGYNPTDYTETVRTYGHTWNFIDPRNSDSNIGNCLIRNGISSFAPGTTTGILSIGQDKDQSSQFHGEVEKREWAYAQRQTGEAGGFHDPMYKNVFDMVGDNADMIWETEGLIFETSPNLSCLYNESDAYDQSLTNPLDFATLGTDPDRYVGLMPKVQDTDFSSFTIPSLKDGDRVLIFMKSGEGSGANGINLKVEGAKDALGKVIDDTDVYSAGGTNWQHSRYEGCYHFIKDGDGDMKFTMLSGSMCKLLYIHIYQGQRISTNSLVAQNSDEEDASKLLFINDKDATTGSSATSLSLRFRGKGQHQKTRVLTSSGNLNYSTSELIKDQNIDSHFTVAGAYSQAVSYTSEVGEIGMFRLREADVEYGQNYVADFVDRNFTVGYRDKVDSYPYTWDFTDIKGFSSTAVSNEATNYPIDDAADDEYGDQWNISLFDADGYMKLNTGFDPEGNNNIFDAHRIGYGNQLWADTGAIPETKGLWFYSDDNYALYNNCLQITSEGISFCNIPDANGEHKPWWNYKMVVPDVPANAAVYLRMKRDSRVKDTDKMYSDKDKKNVLFLNTRFHFGTTSSSNQKTSLTEDVDDVYSTVYRTQENGTNYSFYQVPGTDDEYILVVKNTTGATDHLTYTLNGWIVEKLAISEDAKTVNRLGWATESRARVIDPALTSELTGYPFNTYIVTDASYADKTVTLTPVDVTTDVMPIAADGDNNAYIIQNTLLDEERKEGDIAAPGRVQILNNGFHLFVPDMHDYVAGRQDGITNQKSPSAMGSNMLVSLLTAQTVNKKGSGNIYNYALTSQKNKVGDADNQTYLEEIGFYRIKNGTQSNGNLAYLPVDCSETPVNNGAKMSIIFTSFDKPGETVTSIKVPFEEVFGGSDAVYYNLNGQKLNGKPTKGGLYIMNGKKILVK